jgi:hypothetical protein
MAISFFAVDHDPRLRDALAGDTLVGNRAAEGDALGGALAHLLERELGLADQTHAMVDAPRPEAPLSNLEAAALAEEHVGRRHAHILQLDLHVAVRRVVIAEYRQMAQHFDSFCI